MTVKEAVSVLRGANTIRLAWGASSSEFDPDDPVMMDAYGKYVVSFIGGYEENNFEVGIAMRPVKEEE